MKDVLLVSIFAAMVGGVLYAAYSLERLEIESSRKECPANLPTLERPAPPVSFYL